MVTFPAVIESGSEAKLCASLLKPNESLVMNIYLVHGDQSTLLLQEKAEEEFHSCFNFQTPLVEAESVQTMKVELQGKNFKMTEERKVVFRLCNLMLYHIIHFTVNFRVVTMDKYFVPFDQKDSQNNRIGQWTNISSTRWILQLSHELNPEARQGNYKLRAFIGERVITHYFKVKKYVLPKFEITMKAPKEISFGDSDMKMEVCGKYTFGQPVAGKARVEVCRELLRYTTQTDLISPCLVETTEMSEMGCASFTLDTSVFFNSTNERFLKRHLTVKMNVTEEGTENTLGKSEMIILTYESGKATFTELPEIYEHGSVIQGKIKLAHLNGAPLQNKEVYLLEVFSSDGSSTVTVQSAGDTHLFDVNQDNKLLYQEKQLQNVPAKYSIEVKGSTCVSVQVAQFYNIPTPTEDKTLSIDAKLEGDCKKTFGQDLLLNFTVNYNGPQERSNMVIVDIKLLSGFTADTSLVTSLVERVDSKDDHVIGYLKEVPKNIPVNLQIKLKQVLPVKNLKPAVIKVYDYYQTSDQSETEYTSHCA
uniref:Alpha-macroglobulin receptor-binding domain-containing protein n=1 Tax=Cyprinus carpio TaxID=7962 RepID=A0A8C1TL38_CYPCA